MFPWSWHLHPLEPHGVNVISSPRQTPAHGHSPGRPLQLTHSAISTRHTPRGFRLTFCPSPWACPSVTSALSTGVSSKMEQRRPELLRRTHVAVPFPAQTLRQVSCNLSSIAPPSPLKATHHAGSVGTPPQTPLWLLPSLCADLWHPCSPAHVFLL